MSKKIEIEIDPIEFENENQKKNVQYTTKVHLVKDGKKVYPDEVTGFMFHEYSGFAPAKFFAPEKRDFIKAPINEEEKSSVDFMNTIEKYDKALHDQKESVFGKFAKLYTIIPSVKEPKEEDELEMETDAGKPKKPKTKSIKLRLNTGWKYYYDNVALEKDNTIIIRKAVTDFLAKGGDKKDIGNIIVELVFKDGDKQSKKKLKMNEIESRKEITTKVYYRKVENLATDAKKVYECTDNEELEQYYGEPQLVDVKSAEDLDKYYRFNCYIRFLYGPSKVWAAKTKDDNGKRKTSLQFVCHQMDIIHIKTNSNTQSTARSIYSGYGFGSRTQNEIKVKTVDSNDESDAKATNIEKSGKTDKVDNKKVTKQSVKVDSDSESEAESEKSESEKSESEAESESDSDSEPEPPKKGAKGKAVVEEKTKSKAPVKRK